VFTFRRPSAALVMGWAAGALAAFTFAPTAIPLIWDIIQSEEQLGQRHTLAAALVVESALRRGAAPDENMMSEQALSYLAVTTAEGEWRFGQPLEAELVAKVCTGPGVWSGLVKENRRQEWAVSCAETEPQLRVVAGYALDPVTPTYRVLLLITVLALFVGIVTALGVLRIMRPLSAISTALQRVGAGERGVTVSPTGLAELDSLVDRLNAASRSVDDREDAILSRIEVVQEMARMVAHEVRNPLQSLELLTSLVVSEDEASERQQIGASIHSEIRTLEQVVNRLLRESAAKGSLRLQMSKQSVAPLVEHVVALRRPQASQQGIRLTTGPLSMTEATFDQPLVKRSIENLVLNALQAVPKGSGEVRVSVYDEPEHVVVLVEDNGPGVSPELLEHVFEPNVSGRPGGTGLGLALVKGVVEAHSGYVRYGRSSLGGARFEARLPYSPPQQPGEVPESATRPGAAPA
jgi:signal transduction histidine kinase